MTLSDPRRITDELLSAYIDDEVTDQERAIVEAALAADEEVVWRLNSLRQTVTLLHDLPELALPRSFALTLDQVRSAQGETAAVMAGAAERQPAAPRKAAPSPHKEEGFWAGLAEGWRNFWQGGNPMLRNAAAVSFALMLAIVVSAFCPNRITTIPPTASPRPSISATPRRTAGPMVTCPSSATRMGVPLGAAPTTTFSMSEIDLR